MAVLSRPAGTLLNHLVSRGQQRFRDGEAEKLGSLKVDDELELGRLQHRQVGGLGAVEDFAGDGSPANDPQQSWGFGWEPPEAVMKDSGTRDGIL